ncbi:MAG: tripartite tricarboxylate transporter permease [Syntrophaceae bacterium]|nr:tripartite tricarboxylate transporter permease [Syntrophaceae bacterium]
MDVLHHLYLGFSVALTPVNLVAAFLGCMAGTAIGVLPGIGPVVGITLLLPMTYGMDPTTSLIVIAAIYYGSMYGGSTTSILINVPGEAASVVTCLDGYQMARKGKAGAALGISAIGSFVAGIFSVLGLMLLAPMVVPLALKFGPSEYFSLMVLGLTTVAYLSGGSLVKGLLMALVGLGVSVVGMDALTSKVRFTFGVTELWNGIDFVAVTMGLFAIPEILVSVENWARQEVFSNKIKGIWPNQEEFRRSAGPMARGSALGFFTGIIPGGGPLLASFFSYALEKSISKHPERFGTGTIEGVAGPEAANNSGTGGALVPLFALGLPCNVVTAIMLNAFIMQGLRPGPMLMQEQPQLFWGVVASMFIGNLVLLVLNLPLVGLFVRLLRVPYRILLPFIVLFCVIGAYAVNNQVFGIWLMLIFGVFGYFLRKGNYPAAPVVLGLVIGPMLEGALRQALTVSQGDISVFFTRPLSLSMLVIALGVVSVPFWRMAVRKKEGLRAPGNDPNVS